MSAKHQTAEWQRLVRTVKPRLMTALPAPCPRCGQVMLKQHRLDVGHISLDPALRNSPQNVRLEHRSCNRKHGQRITTALRTGRNQKKERLPQW
jgi:hypothetical protein